MFQTSILQPPRLWKPPCTTRAVVLQCRRSKSLSCDISKMAFLRPPADHFPSDSTPRLIDYADRSKNRCVVPPNTKRCLSIDDNEERKDMINHYVATPTISRYISCYSDQDVLTNSSGAPLDIKHYMPCHGDKSADRYVVYSAVFCARSNND
jgi:hypothetical protein